MPVGGRVAKSGYSNENGYTSDGRSYLDINDELWTTSIAMAILILILIGFALLYILYEKCQKKREHFINA